MTKKMKGRDGEAGCLKVPKRARKRGRKGPAVASLTEGRKRKRERKKRRERRAPRVHVS